MRRVFVYIAEETGCHWEGSRILGLFFVRKGVLHAFCFGNVLSQGFICGRVTLFICDCCFSVGFWGHN